MYLVNSSTYYENEEENGQAVQVESVDCSVGDTGDPWLCLSTELRLLMEPAYIPHEERSKVKDCFPAIQEYFVQRSEFMSRCTCK